MNLSIFFVSLPELTEINRSMAKRAIFDFIFLHFALVHLVLAALAAVVVTSNDRFTTYHAGWEVAAAGPANGIVFADGLLAVTSRTFYPFSRGFFRRMLGEYAHSDIHVLFTVFWVSHSFKFDKCSRTFFVTLNKRVFTLL